MSYSQTDIDRLRAAIATGAREVQMGSERVVYRTLAEMRDQLSVMEASLSATSRTAYFQPTFSRGT